MRAFAIAGKRVLARKAVALARQQAPPIQVHDLLGGALDHHRRPCLVQTLNAPNRVVKLLKARDEDGSTPLHLAAAFSETSSVVEELLLAGANAKDAEGKIFS